MTNNSNFENAYALIIGISRYQDPNIRKLDFTRADAEGIFDLVTDPEKMGIRKDNVKVLLDENATRFNIRTAISDWLFTHANKDSFVFIYFAGHGHAAEDRTGIEKDNLVKYLLPFDTVVKDIYNSAISNRDFHELLLTIKSQKLVIFMDSCYSGGVSGTSRDITPNITDDPYEKLGKGEGRIVIAASKPNQVSYEDAKLGHGVFTYNLLKALSGEADWDNDGYVTVYDAMKYLENTVPKMALQLSGGTQEPILRGEVTKDIIISVNRDRRKLAILKGLYDAENISAKMYNRLRRVIQNGTQNLPDEDKHLTKLFNDFYSGDVSQDIFLESLKDYGPILPKPEQPELEIRGTIIIQDTNSPLDDVNITFKIDNVIKKTVSEKDGSFSFNVSRQYLDRFAVYEATRTGYQTRNGRFQIKDKKNEVQLEISLEPEKEKEPVPPNISTKIFSLPGQAKIALLLIALIAIGILFIPQKPELSVSPDPISFNIGELNAGENTSQTFTISNQGKGRLDWTVSADKSWISVYPTKGTDSGKINIEVNTAVLQPGEYSGTISIKSNGGDKNGIISINITAPHADLVNPMGMEFVQIPAGSFEMGSPSSEIGRWPWEGPLHNVEFKKPFYIGKYEVTQKQWADIMGNDPSVFKDEKQPVELITWDDVSIFIKKLNEMERTNKYRLPSEAEWEYAARAGTTTKYYFGDNDSELKNFAWFNGDSAGAPHSIGQKKPNRWGLYDINGNVLEWVQDKWIDNYNTVPSDGSAWIGGLLTDRVIRGGSWNSGPETCRSAFRFHAKQIDSSGDIGFRVAKDV